MFKNPKNYVMSAVVNTSENPSNIKFIIKHIMIYVFHCYLSG